MASLPSSSSFVFSLLPVDFFFTVFLGALELLPVEARLLFHWFAFLSFAIRSIVFPETTDLFFSRMSFSVANLSRCLINSHELSSLPLVRTRANSPFSFLPCIRIFTEPFWKAFNKCCSWADFSPTSSTGSYVPSSQIITVPAP